MAKPVYISVHVTPRSGRDEVLGVAVNPAGNEVRIRVTAAPDDGLANKAVCKLVARSIGVPKLAVCVARGQASRHKRLAVDACPDDVYSWMAALPRL